MATFRPDRVQTATLVLLAGQVLVAGSAFLVNLFAARVLEPAGRGELALALQVSYLFTTLLAMGLEKPFMASRDGGFNTEYQVIARLVAPGALVALPLLLIVFPLLPFSDGWFWGGVAVVVGYVLLNALVVSTRVAFVVSHGWREFGFNNIGGQLILVLGAGALLLADATNPTWWMAAYLVSTAPAVILLIRARARDREVEHPRAEERRVLRRRGLSLLPATFGSMAMLKPDRLLLPILSSPEQLGFYVTVATVMEMGSWPIMQWVDASLRQWSEDAEQRGTRFLGIVVKSAVFVVLVTVVLGVVADQMVVHLLPADYLQARAAIVPLGVAGVFYGVSRVQQGLLIAGGRTATVSAVEIVSMLVSFVGYLVFIPRLGMIGAAYGSIVGYGTATVLTALVLAIFSRKAG